MIRSIRLDATSEDRLKRAAEASGMSRSEFIRSAVSDRCDAVLGHTLAERLQGSLGVIRSGGGRARRTGRKLGKLLKEKKAA